MTAPLDHTEADVLPSPTGPGSSLLTPEASLNEASLSLNDLSIADDRRVTIESLQAQLDALRLQVNEMQAELKAISQDRESPFEWPTWDGSSESLHLLIRRVKYKLQADKQCGIVNRPIVIWYQLSQSIPTDRLPLAEILAEKSCRDFPTDFDYEKFLGSIKTWWGGHDIMEMAWRDLRSETNNHLNGQKLCDWLPAYLNLLCKADAFQTGDLFMIALLRARLSPLLQNSLVYYNFSKDTFQEFVAKIRNIAAGVESTSEFAAHRQRYLASLDQTRTQCQSPPYGLGSGAPKPQDSVTRGPRRRRRRKAQQRDK